MLLAPPIESPLWAAWRGRLLSCCVKNVPNADYRRLPAATGGYRRPAAAEEDSPLATFARRERKKKEKNKPPIHV